MKAIPCLCVLSMPKMYGPTWPFDFVMKVSAVVALKSPSL